MGATHTAVKIVDSLRQNYAQKPKFWPQGAVVPDDFLPFPGKDIEARWDFVRHVCGWAALLHDVGHIPLGHTLEDEFERLYPKHDDFHSQRLAYLWSSKQSGLPSEIRSVLLSTHLYPESFQKLGVVPDEVFGAVLLSCLHKEGKNSEGMKKPFCQVVQELDENDSPIHKLVKKSWTDTLRNYSFAPYFADIVGDTICADYLDYLRRDPTNVGLDVLRDDRVISRFYVGKEEADEPRLYRMALSLVDRSGHQRLDTCTGVIDLVRQRFRFAEIIYYHKTKVSASAMFAKAIKLIGKPADVGPEKQTLHIEDIGALRMDLCEAPEKIGDLKRQMLPQDLLDPEIGDESLHLLMQFRAWDNVENAAREGKRGKVERSLRGLALLQAIARRHLYKTCFVLDGPLIADLMPDVAQDTVDSRIARIIHELRDEGAGDGEDFRTKLESEITAAAEWPDDALILYVPSRKSQAKGIETYALQGNTVVTLEKHPAVQNKVAELNTDYKGLWRMILLINPDSKYVNDAVGLSKAIDILVRRIVTLAENQPDLIESRDWSDTLSKACWLRYVTPRQRVAAQVFAKLSRTSPPAWHTFDRVSEKSEERGFSCSSIHHAALAFMFEANAEFPLEYAIGHVVGGAEFARRIDVAMAGWNVKDTDDAHEARRAALIDLGQELLDKSVASTTENVIPISRNAGLSRSESAGPQQGLGLEHMLEAKPLAARTSPPEALQSNPSNGRTSSVPLTSRPSRPVVPDQEVFSELSSVNKTTKTWRERLATLDQFFREDHLGSFNENRDFIELAEKEAAGKSKTYVYGLSELRKLYARFKLHGA
jgi:HD superfamily phosphohydrolase